jgi:hypothetical protein
MDTLDLHIARLQASAVRIGRVEMLVEIIQAVRTHARTLDDVWEILGVLTVEAEEVYDHPDQMDCVAYSALDYMRQRQETRHE